MDREFDKTIEYAKTMCVTPINKDTGRNGDIYDVKGYYVRVFNKKGRKLITCTCENDSRNPNEPTICTHKIAVMRYLIMNEKQERAREIKEEYERFQKDGCMIKESYEDYIERLLRLILK